MTQEKMNVHKALCELKVMDERIQKAIDGPSFVKANKHSNDKIDGISVEKYKEKMKSNFQKVNDLIIRRNALKRAIVMSNARTTVVVDGVEYTVAEAIDMKNQGMIYTKYFCNMLIEQLSRARKDIEKNSGDSLENRAENYVLSVIQAQPKDSKMTIDSDAMKKLREEYIKNNTYDLIDPNSVEKAIEEMTEKIQNFNSEIDAALSVSNAITIVEFEY